MILSRRQFLQSCLALAAAPAIVKASSLMPLARPARWTYGATFPLHDLYVYSMDDIQEHVDHSYIDCSTLLSTAKEYMLGLSTYSYTARRIDLQSWSHGVLDPRNVLADGVPLDLDMAREITVGSDGRLVIKDLPLAPFGNRVPEFSYRSNEWEES